MSRRRDGRGVGGGGYFLEIWQRGGGSGSRRTRERSAGGEDERKPMCWFGGVGNARVPWSPSHLRYWLFAIAVWGTSGAMDPPAHPRCRREVRRSTGLVIHKRLYYACVSSGYCYNLENENTSSTCITAAALLLLAG